MNIYIGSQHIHSHHTGITEIVQAIKSIEENIEENKEMKIWDQTMYLLRK